MWGVVRNEPLVNGSGIPPFIDFTRVICVFNSNDFIHLDVDARGLVV